MLEKNYIFDKDAWIDEENPLICGKILHVGRLSDGQLKNWHIGPGKYRYKQQDVEELLTTMRAYDLIKRLAYIPASAMQSLIIDLQRLTNEQNYKCWLNPKKKSQIKKIVRKGKARIERAKRDEEVS